MWRPSIVALALAGCATAGGGPSAAVPPTRAALQAWTARDAVRPRAPGVVRGDASGARAVAAPRRVEVPRAHGPRVDVHLERARLSNALRMLCEAAGLGVVIGEGLDRPITVDLRRVRPVEAMRALSEAYDIDLRLIGRTVIARRRSGS